MSLINDALKRAEVAQQHKPPPAPDHLPLRPVDPQAAVTRGLGLGLPLVLAGTALLLLFFAWRFYMDAHRGAGDSLVVAAKSETSPEPTPPTTPAPIAAPEAAPQPASVPAATPLSPINAKTPASTNMAAAPAATNDAAAVSQSPPRPPPLKLQGVVYSKSRPSAVINGKTVFLGDRVREFRVTSIGVDNVTLAGPERTNIVLMLSD